MNIGMFIIGGIIFSVYMYFTIWNIYYSSKKQREENYPTLKKKKTPSGTSGRKSVKHTVRSKKQNVRVKVNEKV